MANTTFCVVSMILAVYFLTANVEAASISRDLSHIKSRHDEFAIIDAENATSNELTVRRRSRRSPEVDLTNIDARTRDPRAKAKLLDSLFGTENRHHFFNSCIDLYVEEHGHHHMLKALRHCMMVMP